MRFVAGRGAVVAKLLRPGDATEQDAAGRGALEETLAGAPWWICWPGRQGGAAGRGYRGEEDGGTVAGVAASGRNCRGMEQCTKKPAGVSWCETLAGVR